MADIGKVEYQVRKVTRYHVTRYYESAEGRVGGTESKGEYDNPDIAHEVAYALCKAEHERFGGAPGDERFIYPKRDVAPVAYDPLGGVSPNKVKMAAGRIGDNADDRFPLTA